MKSLKHRICGLAAAVVLLMTSHGSADAQIGDHRNDLSVGVNAGYIISNVGFTPKVTQQGHGGITMGLSMRYTCEKYFSTICSIAAEVNYARIGWKENILTSDDQPVINAKTGLAEAYQRDLNYIQVPIFAHLAWDMRPGHDVRREQVRLRHCSRLRNGAGASASRPFPPRRSLLLRSWQHLRRLKARLFRPLQPLKHRNKADLSLRYREDKVSSSVVLQYTVFAWY